MSLKRRFSDAPPATNGPAHTGEILLDLGDIIGLDPANSRQERPSEREVEEFASALYEFGQLHPLLLRGLPGQGYRVVDGGRRFYALQRLAERGKVLRVRARVFVGSDEDARAWSLACNHFREDLHPLELAEQVAALAGSTSLAELERRFGKKFVARQLKLAALPDAAKALWREDRFGEDIAKLLAGATPEQVARVLEEDDLLDDPEGLRWELRDRSGVDARADKRAIFVGLEAFAAAGGAVEEDLFDERVSIVNTPLLDRLVNQKLSALGQQICEEEGWGTLLLQPDATLQETSPDPAAAEVAEANEIATALKDPALSSERRAALEARVDEITRLGVLRAISPERRHLFALYVSLDADGRLAVSRGLYAPVRSAPSFAASATDSVGEASSPRMTEPMGDEAFSSEAAASTRQAFRARPVSDELNPHARARLEMALGRALGSLVARNVGAAAQLFAAAAVQNTIGPVQIRRLQGPFASVGPDARMLARRVTLATALDQVAGWDEERALAALAELVASSIRFNGFGAGEAALIAFAHKRFGDAWAAAIGTQLDYRALFLDGGEPLARAAIRDCVGEAGLVERAHLSGASLISEAATLARAKAWLPASLPGGAP